MQLNRDFAAPSNLPEWLVCNGSVTVGPVPTDLLLRGVLHGRVPDSCWVRQPDWQSWRELGKIREVSALRRVLERKLDEPSLEPGSLTESPAALSRASDAGEVLLIALHVAALATSATVGLAHRIREPLRLPTTSCLFDAPSDRLGQVLPWFDPAFVLARAGRGFMTQDAGAGHVQQALHARLSPEASLASVAMVPVLLRGKLHAMLELGRSDHAFRSSDAALLSGFADQVAVALGRLGS